MRDITDPFANSGTIYFKAAWVVHMLREMINDDDLFFSILETYLADHAYSNAETSDLRIAFETGMGTSLVPFFDQWIYSPAWPIYSAIYENSSSGGYKVDINLQQVHTHGIVDIDENPVGDCYIMPVSFTVHYTDETTETFTVTNDQRNQSFQLDVSKEPDYTVFDESLDILKEKTEEVSDNDGIPCDGDYSGIPGDNPCTGGATADCDDNCPDTPNGPDLGLCAQTLCGDFEYSLTQCTNDGDCGGGCWTCLMAQEDNYPPGGNGIGDACEWCYADMDDDGSVYPGDLMVFLGEYGRTDCLINPPCQSDFDEDGNVYPSDLMVFLGEYGRTDCLVITP